MSGRVAAALAAVLGVGLLACATLPETTRIVSANPFTSTYVQTAHKDYGFYVDWSRAPTISFRIDASSDAALDRFSLDVDGRSLAARNGISGNSAGGVFVLPPSPRVAKLVVRTRQGTEVTWRYDFKTGHVEISPFPRAARRLQREN